MEWEETILPIYEFTIDMINPVKETTFAKMGLYESKDLQRLLRENIAVISPDTLVIAEEFAGWDGSSRRIDLLGIDRDAKLVVIELKRTEDGGHMELQAIRYAAMVSTMTFHQAVDVYGRYLDKDGAAARNLLLDFLGWDEPNEDAFAQDVRIVLASAEFGQELTTSVFWLIDRAIDIRCVRLKPYNLEGRVLVDVQQIIPLPEMADYQIRISEKRRKEREAHPDGRDRTYYDVTLGDRQIPKLPKRRAIYKVFRYLVENGISPEQVAEQCGKTENRALMSVEGEIPASEFVHIANGIMEKEGRTFDDSRYFCGDDELVHVRGSTYAFTNQWGDPDWSLAITDLCKAFPTLRLEFARSQ